MEYVAVVLELVVEVQFLLNGSAMASASPPLLPYEDVGANVAVASFLRAWCCEVPVGKVGEAVLSVFLLL